MLKGFAKPSSHLRHKSREIAQNRINQLQKPRIIGNPFLLIKKIGSILERGDLDYAWYYIRSHPAHLVTTEVYNAYLSACAARGFVNPAAKAYVQLKKSQLKPSERTFTALLQSLAVQAKCHPADAKKRELLINRLTKIKAQMAHYGIAWNVYHANSMINLLRFLGFHKSAVQLYIETFETSIKEKSKLLSIVTDPSQDGLQAFKNSGVVKEKTRKGAVPGLADMDQQWTKDEVDDFENYMETDRDETWTMQNFPEECLAISVDGHKLKPDSYTFSTLIGICGDQGGQLASELLSELLKDMKDPSSQIDASLMVSLLRAFGSTNDLNFIWKSTRLLKYFFNLNAPLPTLNLKLKPQLAIYDNEATIKEPKKVTPSLFFAILSLCKQFFPEIGEHYYCEIVRQNKLLEKNSNVDFKLQKARLQCLVGSENFSKLLEIGLKYTGDAKAEFRIYAFSKKMDKMHQKDHYKLVKELQNTLRFIKSVSEIILLAVKQAKVSNIKYLELADKLNAELGASDFLFNKINQKYSQKYSQKYCRQGSNQNSEKLVM